MVKRILFLVLGFVFVFSVAAECDQAPLRSLFVSVIQNPPVLSSRKDIAGLIDFAKQAHIKILFVQIYHSGQSWFPSQIVDDSWYDLSRRAVLEDPLALLIREAHAQRIQVHAWLNLMSLGGNKDASFIKKYGTEILTQNLNEKHKLEDYKIDNQYFLEPGDPRVGNDLAQIVLEVINRYPDLDGMQFDYIRYPDVHPHYGYTKINMERFKKSSGLKAIDEASPVWQDWRRAQVTEVLKKLVRTIRSRRPKMQISTTGCMPYARAYYEAYQNWPSWIDKGIVDFVTIMDYSTDVIQFKKWIMVIKGKTADFSKVHIAVGAEKLVHKPEIFENEFNQCEQMKANCTIFHYGNLLENPKLREFFVSRSHRS